MMSIPTRSRFRMHPPGNALVLFIIIILFAVGAVLYLQSTAKEPTGPVEQYPWTETHRIVADSSLINLPASPQFVLEDEKSMMHPIVSEDGQKRGRLEITMEPEGLVAAIWTARHKEDIYEKEFKATCTGNVDASRLFEDESGTDPSKLFFITEGTFILQAFKHGNAMLNGGEAYVVGWLNPDGSADGTLVLTPDKKTTKIYKWGND